MKRPVILSVVLKNLAIVWIILMAFIRAGSVSIIYWGDPLYKGSTNFSKVVRYFTLSLASLSLSVNNRSSLPKSWLNFVISSPKTL